MVARPVSAFQPWQKTGPTKHSVAKRTPCLNGHDHDSKREAKRCNELHVLQSGGEIAGLKSQPFYGFNVDGTPVKMANGHLAGVTLDFSYVDCRKGVMVAEDVKPRSKLADSRDWPLRKAFFKHLYPMIDLREVRK